MDKTTNDAIERRPYHHGDLRRVLLNQATKAIEESGVAALSLRELARRAGVSHAAPAHHFRDKAGLLTAVAVEGYELLAAEMQQAAESGGFLDIGVAYVRFALEHRAHFEVMYQPELFDVDDPELIAARAKTRQMLYGPLTSSGERVSPLDVLHAGVAAWSMVHGFATLWINGILPPQLGDDPEQAARAVASVLFQPFPGLERREP